MINLYDYQDAALIQVRKNKKGIICMPTGTGKTLVEANIIAEDIIMNKGSANIYLFNSPTIVLTYQLLQEVYALLAQKNIDAIYHLNHSGRPIDIKQLEEVRINYGFDFRKIGASTSSDVLYGVMKDAELLQKPLIIFSTYHSSERVELARKLINKPISVIINDEAHYLVRECFYDILKLVQSERCYFFTATTKITASAQGRGMNNVESYGEVIYKLIPREAIDMGKMLRPRIQYIVTDGIYTEQDYDASIISVIYNSVLKHEEHLEKEHKELTPKIIVSVRGSQEIKDFLKSKEYNKLREQGYCIFSIMSNEEIGCDINKFKYSKPNFLNKLKEYGKKVEQKMLILHYDMLTVGIDIPSCTAFLPLRTLNKTSFIQTLGRCSRLDIRDREKFENKTLSINDENYLEKMVKPYAYILLQDIQYKDGFTYMESLVQELRDYGYEISEDIFVEDIAKAIDEKDSIEGFNELNKKDMQAKIIFDVNYRVEIKEICDLQGVEQLKKLFNIV